MVTFDRLVDNGTPCSYEKTNHICIDGKCEVCGSMRYVVYYILSILLLVCVSVRVCVVYLLLVGLFVFKD